MAIAINKMDKELKRIEIIKSKSLFNKTTQVFPRTGNIEFAFNFHKVHIPHPTLEVIYEGRKTLPKKPQTSMAYVHLRNNNLLKKPAATLLSPKKPMTATKFTNDLTDSDSDYNDTTEELLIQTFTKQPQFYASNNSAKKRVGTAKTTQHPLLKLPIAGPTNTIIHNYKGPNLSLYTAKSGPFDDHGTLPTPIKVKSVKTLHRTNTAKGGPLKLGRPGTAQVVTTKNAEAKKFSRLKRVVHLKRTSEMLDEKFKELEKKINICNKIVAKGGTVKKVRFKDLE